LPLCCIRFEDWTGVDALALLAIYRDKVCCYNDDIQGTAAHKRPYAHSHAQSKQFHNLLEESPQIVDAIKE
jgi:hypothetical protein